MEVVPAWSRHPCAVFAISVHSALGRDFAYGDNLTFSVLDGEALDEVKARECEVTDPSLDGFVLMPRDFSQGVVLMWRPLAEAGIWAALREYDPKAILHFARLRQEFM